MINTSFSLVAFEFVGRHIRVFTDELGEPWFVAADVCTTLAIGHVSQALRCLEALADMASSPADKQDSSRALPLISYAEARGPGLKPGVAMAASITCVQQNTGMDIETLREAPPPTEVLTCSRNLTGRGQLRGMKAKDTNQHRPAFGLQVRTQLGGWKLPNAARRWWGISAVFPQGNSGCQILWNPDVVDVIWELG